MRIGAILAPSGRAIRPWYSRAVAPMLRGAGGRRHYECGGRSGAIAPNEPKFGPGAIPSTLRLQSWGMGDTDDSVPDEAHQVASASCR